MNTDFLSQCLYKALGYLQATSYLTLREKLLSSCPDFPSVFLFLLSSTFWAKEPSDSTPFSDKIKYTQKDITKIQTSIQRLASGFGYATMRPVCDLIQTVRRPRL